MASAERIQLIRCPGCNERVIAPPRDSAGVWQCPFCRRRFRRRLQSASSSGTIPCIDLFSRHPWPPDVARGLWRPMLLVLDRAGSVILAAYGALLVLLMLAVQVASLVLAAAWLVVRLPVLIWKTLDSDDEPDSDDAPRRPAWLDDIRLWTPSFRSSDPDLNIGPALTDEDAPGILVVVAEMARKVGAAKPDEIRITHLPCCGVLEQRGWAGLRSRRRTLVLGLPLLHVLSVEELRAAIAHELAHLSSGDAALAFMISHFVDALDQAIGHGSESRWAWLNPCVILAWLVRGAFRVLSSPLSRHQEYRADAVAASVCGGDVVAGSLSNAALVQPIFKEVLCDYHPMMISEANLFQFFRAAWDAISLPLREEIKRSLIAEERAEFCGLHPTLRARLRRLEQFAPHREPDSRPARRLLVQRRRLESLLHDHIYRTRTRQLSVFRPAGD